MTGMSGSLFETDEPPQQAARLSPVLRSLAERGIYFGTSSWKYEGWLGSIYSRDRYLSRGRFSKKKFEAECLREYAETFPVVGGDFSFYQFPTADYWSRLFADVPPDFGFGLKVPETITVARWPGHARYGAKAGEPNEHFLDASLLDMALLRALEPHRRRVPVLMFEFGAFSKSDFARPEDFHERLERFLRDLPPGWNYGVEIRNKDYLTGDYFDLLSRHNVAHVFNAWTRMPTIADQIAMPGAFTADFTVVRALLQKGRDFEQAVAMFQPYEKVQDPDEGTRGALRQIADRAQRARQRAYIFVNNRLEGHAPTTIEAVASAGPR
jgi:uncharacterized protein YecE (DUF72 family)